MLAVGHVTNWPINTVTKGECAGKVAARECAWSIAKSKPERMAISVTGTAKVDPTMNVQPVTRE
jgi:hypothetical protein